MSQITSRFWWKKALPPKGSVDGPKSDHAGGFCYFFHNDNDMMALWPHIKQLTESGQLGHYSGFSDDRQMIAVHYSDPLDTEEKLRIKSELKAIGVEELRWKRQDEAYTREYDHYGYKSDFKGESDFQYIKRKAIPRDWVDWVFETDQRMSRPEFSYEGAFVYFSFEDFNKIGKLWPKIKKLTEKSALGYLSTTDREIIGVHCADMDQMVRAYNVLNSLGVKKIRLITESEALYNVETAFEWIDEFEETDESDESEEETEDSMDETEDSMYEETD